MVGLPIIGLATTEMVTVIENRSGYVDTDIDKLVEVMRQLLKNPDEARTLSEGARVKARSRFNIQRFTRDWNEAFALVTEKSLASRSL